MGGRGGNGMTANRGNGIKIPALTGTEKQIDWATDILKKPHELMLANAKLREKFAAKAGGTRELKEADALKAAAKRYAAQIATLPNMEAKQIIDKRSGLRDIAYNILVDEYKKRGFKPFEAPRHIF